MKLSIDDIKNWLGSDQCPLELLTEIANGDYDLSTFLFEVYSYREDSK